MNEPLLVPMVRRGIPDHDWGSQLTATTDPLSTHDRDDGEDDCRKTAQLSRRTFRSDLRLISLRLGVPTVGQSLQRRTEDP